MGRIATEERMFSPKPAGQTTVLVTSAANRLLRLPSFAEYVEAA